MKTNDWRSIPFPGLPEQEPEYEALDRWAQEVNGGVAIEIGSYWGRSTALLAQHFEAVLAIDMWGVDDFAHPGERGTAAAWGIFHKNMRERNLYDRVIVLCGTSDNLKFLNPKNVGLVFVDGNHSAEGCTLDAKNCLPHLTKGGLMVFHDHKRAGYDPDPWYGVGEAVDKIRRWPEFELYNERSGIVALRKVT